MKKTHKNHRYKYKARRRAKKRHREEGKKNNSAKHQDARKMSVLDLNKELFPMAHYISDRAEMLNQMFTSLDRKHVKAMLPPHLKDASITRIKELALGELLGMSRERVISILHGQQLENSSESEIEVQNVTVTSELMDVGASCSSSNYIYDVETPFLANGYKFKERSTNKAGIDEAGSRGNSWKYEDHDFEESLEMCASLESDHPSDFDTLEIGITSKEIGDLLKDSSVMKEEESAVNEKKGKTLLEILELEMRARAIRALLKQQGDDYFDISSETQNPKLPKIQICGDKLHSEGLNKKTYNIENVIPKSKESHEGSAVCLYYSNKAPPSVGMESMPYELPKVSTSQNCNTNEDVQFINKRESMKGASNMLLQKACQSQPDISCCSGSFNVVGYRNVATTVSSNCSDTKEDFSEVSLDKTRSVSGHQTDNSWAARWFKSKDVQKVVSTSRMCAKIRKRMKLRQKLKHGLNNVAVETQIIGSVNEYKTLIKTTSSNGV